MNQLEKKITPQLEKRIVIGDIHGRIDIFSKIYKNEMPDDGSVYSVLLLGDYLDTHEKISPEAQVNGLKILLELQKKHQKEYGEFIMLMGNHDFHYFLDDVHERYSGYNIRTACLSELILKQAVAKHNIKFAEIDTINRTIYSHAGVTNTWINNRDKIAIPVNMIDVASYDDFKFTYGNHSDLYGEDPLNGPLWVRPMSLLSDMYSDYDNACKKVTTWTQIVGHTSCSKPVIAHEDGSPYKEGEDWRLANFWDIDCLSKGYYMVETFDENAICINRQIKQISI